MIAIGAQAQPDNTLDLENEARFTSATVFNDNEYPVLNTQVYLGDFEIVNGPDFEDVISYSSSITEVFVTITPPSGESISVETLTGPTWTENAVGEWEATFSVPSPGESITGTFEVYLEGGTLSDNGSFKIKRASGPD